MQQAQPWERQPGESSPAWEARKRYVQMGPGRSIDRVVRELHKSRALIGRWSSRWDWVGSAAAFDAYRDKLAQEETLRKAVAAQVAEAELWVRRDSEQPELDYGVYLDAYADIVKVRKDVDAGKKVSGKAKLDLQRAYAFLSPLARQARQEMADRRAVRGQEQPASPADRAEQPDHVPGRTLAVLKAFVDFTPPEGGGPTEGG